MEVKLKPSLIKNLIMGLLLALAVAGWTAFGVCVGTQNACEKDEITVECNCTHEITVECDCPPQQIVVEVTVECNCAPPNITIIVECNCPPSEIIVECNCPPCIIIVKCDCEPVECEGCCDCEPCDCGDEPEPILQVTDVQARVNIENNICTLVIDITYDDDSVEQIVVDLENGVKFIEVFGDFTVEALFSVSGFNITSYATVTKN